jgi:hypothetical protein
MDAQRSKPAPPLGILAAVSFLKNTYEIIILDQRLFASDDSFYAKLFNVLQISLSMPDCPFTAAGD